VTPCRSVINSGSFWTKKLSPFLRVTHGISTSVRKVSINLCLATGLAAAGSGGAVCWYSVGCHTQMLPDVCPAVLQML